MDLPKDRAERERYLKYKNIIDTINENLNTCGNIKSACLMADIPYRHYFLAKDYFMNGGKTKPRDELRRKKNLEKIEKIQKASAKIDPEKKPNLHTIAENMLKGVSNSNKHELKETKFDLNSILSNTSPDKKKESVKKQSTGSKVTYIDPEEGFKPHKSLTKTN